MSYRTGYFAMPGTDRRTKVHVVGEHNQLLCKLHVGDGMTFQFCANGIYKEYLECKLCKRLIDEAETIEAALQRRGRAFKRGPGSGKPGLRRKRGV